MLFIAIPRTYSGVETGVHSQVESHQKLKKWYLISPYLTLGIKRYGSMVKCSNPRNGAAPSPTPQCSRYWKRSFRVDLNNGRQLYFFIPLNPIIGHPFSYGLVLHLSEKLSKLLHHQGVLTIHIALTSLRQFLLTTALVKSSRQHPLIGQSWWM